MGQLRNIRKELGLSQAQTAERLGYSLSGYQELETASAPRRVVLLAMSYLLVQKRQHDLREAQENLDALL